jgi:hypothetical protein
MNDQSRPPAQVDQGLPSGRHSLFGMTIPSTRRSLVVSYARSSNRFGLLALPCKEINSIQSKGFDAWKILGQPRATTRRSATNSMYCAMSCLSASFEIDHGVAHLSIDADETAWQCIRQELLLQLNRLGDDTVDLFRGASVLEMVI